MKRISSCTITTIAALFVACAPPQIDTASLPDGVVGSRYFGQLQAEGGTPPYAWQLAEVPAELDWVTLDPNTGLLSGVPVAPISPGATIQVKVTDRLARVDEKAVTISVVRGTPEPLASEIEPGGIAANKYAVVWAEKVNRLINMTSLSDKYTRNIAWNASAEPCAIATNLDTTYWLAGGETLGKISNADIGMGLPQYTNIFGADNARSIAINDTSMFIEHHYGLLSCPLGNCSENTTTTIMFRLDATGAPFAIDETGVYVDDTGERGPIYHNEDTILDWRFGGAMAAAAGVLYLSDPWKGIIYSCPATGCSSVPKIFAAGGGKIMKADKNGLYWITDTGVFMCPLPDCVGGPRTIAVDQSNPIDLAITDDYVIWANGGVPGTSKSGSVVRLNR